MAKKTKKKKSLNKLISTVAFCVVFLLVCVLYYNFSPILNNKNGVNLSSFPIVLNGEETDSLSVHFIDVGQGDAILIKTPDDVSILIDSGDGSSNSNQSLIDYIDSLGITTINYLIATHSDKDHIGGCTAIFENYKVEFVFRPYIYSKNQISQDLSQAFNPTTNTVNTANVYANFLVNTQSEKSDWAFFNYETDLVINYGDGDCDQLILDFMTPACEVSSISYSDVNSYSPMIMLSYRDVKFLFTGDADKTVEEEFLDNYDLDEVDCDILKVGHHGSNTSSSQAFVKSVSPEISIISCGKNNQYDHPKQSVINTLITEGSLLYRTDLQGNIVVTVDSVGATRVQTEVAYQGADLFVGY